MGNQAVALGKLAGGCRLQTYYPITPAADESEYLEANENLDLRAHSTVQGSEAGEQSYVKGGGSILVVQTEDEISAINMASGAVLTGVRASTSTSGPGFSLMAEGLGWAGMNEVPVVITYYQRGAPATGLPTRHGQDDLRFAIHAAHGEFPRIVLTSGARGNPSTGGMGVGNGAGMGGGRGQMRSSTGSEGPTRSPRDENQP